MKIARLWLVLAGAIFVSSSLGATAARADGLPVLGVDVGATGVVTRSGQARYVTIPAGADTIVARVDARAAASALRCSCRGRSRFPRLPMTDPRAGFRVMGTRSS